MENKTIDKYGQLFDSRSTAWLSYIISQTEADIVVSSTWRFSGLDEMQRMWEDRKLPGNVVGITPSHYKCKTGFENSPYADWRGPEIKLYLERLADKGDKVDAYVILDDDIDMLPSQEPFFVKCNAMFGVTCNEAERAIEILNA